MEGFERAMSLLHVLVAGAHLAFVVVAAVGGFLLLNWLG